MAWFLYLISIVYIAFGCSFILAPTETRENMRLLSEKVDRRIMAALAALAGVLFFQVIAPFYPDMVIAPDWQLGLLFGIGGSAGMYCGARLQRLFPAVYIKSILAFTLLFTAIRYLGIL